MSTAPTPDRPPTDDARLDHLRSEHRLTDATLAGAGADRQRKMHDAGQLDDSACRTLRNPRDGEDRRGVPAPVFAPRSDKARRAAITAARVLYPGLNRTQAAAALDDPGASGTLRLVAVAYSNPHYTHLTLQTAFLLLAALAEGHASLEADVTDHDLALSAERPGGLSRAHHTDAVGSTRSVPTGLPERCADPLRIARCLLRASDELG